jgi:hypothetical protein
MHCSVSQINGIQYNEVQQLQGSASQCGASPFDSMQASTWHFNSTCCSAVQLHPARRNVQRLLYCIAMQGNAANYLIVPQLESVIVN